MEPVQKAVSALQLSNGVLKKIVIFIMTFYESRNFTSSFLAYSMFFCDNAFAENVFTFQDKSEATQKGAVAQVPAGVSCETHHVSITFEDQVILSCPDALVICFLVFGWMYALHLNYSVILSGLFEFIQIVFLNLNDKGK